VSVVVKLGNAGNTATFSTVDTLTSGTDTIVLTGAIANASIDLGGGEDTFTLGNATNSATVANTQTITGGTGADSVTLGSALSAAMSVDLGSGAGVNKLTLGNFANTGSVSNVNTLIGGTATTPSPTIRHWSAAASTSAPAATHFNWQTSPTSPTPKPHSAVQATTPSF
jgi:hypothetical protein